MSIGSVGGRSDNVVEDVSIITSTVTDSTNGGFKVLPNVQL